MDRPPPERVCGNTAMGRSSRVEIAPVRRTLGPGHHAAGPGVWISAGVIVLAVALALAGGLLAGVFASWRIAVLRPAHALARVA
jgi:hypothetical protein